MCHPVHVIFGRFVSSYDGDNGKGFQIKYEMKYCGRANPTVTCGSGCGGIFSGESGVITSPNYPGTYPEANCIYIISGPANTTISLTITNLDILLYQNHCFDTLEIYDGSSPASDLLNLYCGNSWNMQYGLPIGPILSTQNNMCIRYILPYIMRLGVPSREINLEKLSLFEP